MAMYCIYLCRFCLGYSFSGFVFAVAKQHTVPLYSGRLLRNNEKQCKSATRFFTCLLFPLCYDVVKPIEVALDITFGMRLLEHKRTAEKQCLQLDPFTYALTPSDSSGVPPKAGSYCPSA